MTIQMLVAESDVASLFTDDDIIPAFHGRLLAEQIVGFHQADRVSKMARWRQAAVVAAVERHSGERTDLTGGATPIDRFCGAVGISRAHFSRLVKTHRVFSALVDVGIKRLLDADELSFSHFYIAANVAADPIRALTEAMSGGWSSKKFKQVLRDQKEWVADTEHSHGTLDSECTSSASRCAVIDANSSKTSIDKASPSSMELPALCDIRHAPIDDLLSTFENDVDAIITDPPYAREFIPLYGDLARLAKSALKQDGVLVVLTSPGLLSDVLPLMKPHIHYLWTGSYFMEGGQLSRIWPPKMYTSAKSLIVCGHVRHWGTDVFRPGDPTGQKHFHKWGQTLEGFIQIVKRFTRPGDLVVDPFLGGGTTGHACLQLGRRFVGGDSDGEAVAASRRRIAGVRQQQETGVPTDVP